MHVVEERGLNELHYNIFFGGTIAVFFIRVVTRKTYMLPIF